MGKTSGAYAAVAQLDRVFGYEPKGRGFESLQPYHKKRSFLIEMTAFLHFFEQFISIKNDRLRPLGRFNFSSTRSKIQAFFKNTSARISAFRWSASSMTWA